MQCYNFNWELRSQLTLPFYEASFHHHLKCRVMIIDLDAHQGNGHEKDFSDDSRSLICPDGRVYILDMYNPGIYPFDHEARRYIDQKVEVVTGTTTDEYLKKLDDALEVAGRMFDPELVVYNAGTDILDGDPLGRLKISPEGIAARDEKVFRFASSRNIPIVMLTSVFRPSDHLSLRLIMELVIRWLYEVQCQNYSRFNNKSLEKTPYRFGEFPVKL
ncbi:hypothetical protein Pint_12941 [Pistacia integerrima]|uniref:Uncharacterized protein n=1 Tax=Pistacia integerrima TaxID=434235 RepID=A0ACC0Y592_9ROSI|nr:hypothetical protein Pint_12941 [Pistacia integerrima]